MSLKYEKLIRKMTLAEKAIMMSGKNTWETVDFEKYGIPSMVMSDGPHGLRRQAGAGDHLGLNASLPATCFPTAAGVANSWDDALGDLDLISREVRCVEETLSIFQRIRIMQERWQQHMFVESRARVLQLVQSILQQTVRSCAVWRTILS